MGKSNFHKEMKEYEKQLEYKAKRGLLSLPEKEEYQRICRNKFRNEQLHKGKNIQLVMGIILISTFFFVKSFWSPTEKAFVFTNHIESVPTFKNSKKEAIIEATTQLNAVHTEIFRVYGEAIDSYNKDKTIPENVLKVLEAQTFETTQEAVMPLVDNLRKTIAKQMALLEYLSITKEIDFNYVDKLQKDIKQLGGDYRKVLYEIWDQCGVEYQK
ncbi:MAG: hypothetical protein AB9856_20050 [Cellulosilyticaceae bacterium]